MFSWEYSVNLKNNFWVKPRRGCSWHLAQSFAEVFFGLFLSSVIRRKSTNFQLKQLIVQKRVLLTSFIFENQCVDYPIYKLNTVFFLSCLPTLQTMFGCIVSNDWLIFSCKASYRIRLPWKRLRSQNKPCSFLSKWRKSKSTQLARKGNECGEMMYPNYHALEIGVHRNNLSYF